jgi:hypothetical protein
LWCLFLDFLALHISHFFLLLGFMILKLHAFSPLWCSSFDFIALHIFMLFFLLVSWSLWSSSSFLHCLQVCWEIQHPPTPEVGHPHLFPSFLQLLKSFNLPPLVFCKSTHIFDFLPSCLQLLGKKLEL